MRWVESLARGHGVDCNGAWPCGTLSWDGFATTAAAVFAAVVVVGGYFLQQHWARSTKRMEVYSEALRAVEDYLESVYLIYRKDGSPETQQRLIAHLSEIQSRIAYYKSLLRLHAPSAVASAYDELVAAVRAEAGAQITAAWKARPISSRKKVPLGDAFDRTRSNAALAKALATMGYRARRKGN